METNGSAIISVSGLLDGMGPSFAAAFVDLWKRVAHERPGMAAEILADVSLRLVDVNYEWRLITVGFVRVVLQHLRQNYPLAMPPQLVDCYASHMDAGTIPEVPLAECEACGLGLPRTFDSCPHCGGQVGLGLHSQKKAARAVMN